jgi:hypothetical protein
MRIQIPKSSGQRALLAACTLSIILVGWFVLRPSGKKDVPTPPREPARSPEYTADRNACASAVDEPERVMNWLDASPNSEELAADCAALLQIHNDPVVDFLIERGPLYERVRTILSRVKADDAPAEAVELLALGSDAAQALSAMPDDALTVRVLAARASVWPRVELLLDLKGLGFDALSPMETSAYLDWLSSQDAQRIQKERAVPLKERITDAVRRGLDVVAPDLSFAAGEPPVLVRLALANGGSDDAGELRQAVLLGAQLNHAAKSCQSEGWAGIKDCAKKAQQLIEEPEWVRTAILLDGRIVMMLMSLPELKSAVHTLSQKLWVHIRLGFAEYHKERAATASTLLLGLVVNRTYDVFEPKALVDAAWKLVVLNPALAIELMLDGHVWKGVVELGNEYNALQKVALLVAKDRGSLDELPGNKGILHKWEVTPSGRALKRNVGSTIWQWVPFVTPYKMVTSADYKWGELIWVTAWDVLTIAPLGWALKSGLAVGTVGQWGGSLVRKTAMTTSKPFLTSVGQVRSLFGRHARAWAVAAGGFPKRSATQSVGHALIKLVPSVARLYEKILTNKALGPTLRFLGSRPGYTAACTGLSLGASFAMDELLKNHFPPSADKRGRIVEKVAETAVSGGFCYAHSKRSWLRRSAWFAGKAQKVPYLPEAIVRVVKYGPGVAKDAATAYTVYKLGPAHAAALQQGLKVVKGAARPHVEEFLGRWVVKTGVRKGTELAVKGATVQAAGYVAPMVITLIERE